jgi:hypothetical protein
VRVHQAPPAANPAAAPHLRVRAVVLCPALPQALNLHPVQAAFLVHPVLHKAHPAPAANLAPAAALKALRLALNRLPAPAVSRRVHRVLNPVRVALKALRLALANLAAQAANPALVHLQNLVPPQVRSPAPR